MATHRSAAVATAATAVGGLCMASGVAFNLAPSAAPARPAPARGSAQGVEGAQSPQGLSMGAKSAGLAVAGLALSAKLAAKRQQRKRGTPAPSVTPCQPRARQQGRTAQQALPEHFDAAQQLAAWVHSVQGVDINLSDIQDSMRENAHNFQTLLASTFVPAAHAADGATEVANAAADAASAAASSLPPAPPGIELDPNQKYVLGADGMVLVDPMGKKPITDDWWNGFIGFQAGLIKQIDQQLRNQGVEQAFGWTIVLYTCLVKALFYPIQQGQLRSTSMMQLMSPKVKELQETYKDDPDTLNRMLGQLYSVMDVNPLGGCVPVLLQLPLFWSLYGVWRRLAAENFEHYDEGWLFVPSLAKPNPDFQFKFDWLLDFTDGQPTMGWHDYGCYLIFPAILVTFTLISGQQAQAQRPKPEAGKEDDPQSLILQFLPLLSVYFIGSLALELPQAVSLYYTTNTAVQLAQTQFVKQMLRTEIPGYEEFEKTGKFPDSAFEDMARSQAPKPTTMHEAALRGDVKNLGVLFDEGEADINGWDTKEITPLGYACAVGSVPCVKYLLEKGADIKKMDGQKNTILHYAAGYGHLEVVNEILEQGKEAWPNNEWAEAKNTKGQTVLDAARVNKKGDIVNMLRDKLGMEPIVEVVEPAAVPPAAPAAEEPEIIRTGQAAAPAAMSAEQSDAAAKARAAMLAMAGQDGADATAAAADAAATANEMSAAAAGAGNPAAAGKTAEAMRRAVAQLKSNPEAVKQARQMMGKMPPQMLSMLTGGKMNADQVQKAMDAMDKMDTDELLSKAETTADKLSELEARKAGTAPAAPAKQAARVVD